MTSPLNKISLSLTTFIIYRRITALQYTIICREASKESRDTNNNIASSVTKKMVGTPTYSCIHFTRETSLEDLFSVLLEYDDVSERSLLTIVLSNGESFYKSSQSHKMFSNDSLSLIS